MGGHVDGGDVHVSEAGSIEGARGEVELVVEHSPEGAEKRREHRFVYRYEYDEDTPGEFTHAGAFVSWDAGGDAIEAETFLSLSHVEQYLHHHGINVDPMLAPGRYPMVDMGEEETFAEDTPLDVEVPDR